MCRCGALDCKSCNPSSYWEFREDPDDHMLACECDICEGRRIDHADRLRDAMLEHGELDWQMEVRADDLRP